MPVKVYLALLSEDGTVLRRNSVGIEPGQGQGGNQLKHMSESLLERWQAVTDEERAEFGEAMVSITRLTASKHSLLGVGAEELGREAVETWRLAGVFGRVNCPHGCKQVAANEECPHGYPSLAKRMGVKF